MELQSDTYDWDSGLTPADGVWTYVALAVAPSQAVIYMYDGTNWSSAANVVDHPVQAFAATTRIGSDSATSRFFTGLLDEAAIYPATLTEGQLHTHALAGFGGAYPPVMVTDPPVVTPTGTIYSTTSFSLTADVYGQPPLKFQWVKDGTAILGATAPSFGKSAAGTNDSGNYSVIVTFNAYGGVTSQVASVTVNSAVPPTITQPPVSRSAYAGGSGSFTVAAEGTTPISYQWTHAGTEPARGDQRHGLCRRRGRLGDWGLCRNFDQCRRQGQQRHGDPLDNQPRGRQLRVRGRGLRPAGRSAAQ